MIKIRILREELGEQVEIVVLEMSVDEQMERVRGRNGGSEEVVEKMKVRLLSRRHSPRYFWIEY